MHANNETGAVQPFAEIAAIARKRGIRFHTDAAQSVGTVPANVDMPGVDLLSVAGHKLYAPKGIGALYVWRGGGQELKARYWRVALGRPARSQAI